MWKRLQHFIFDANFLLLWTFEITDSLINKMHKNWCAQQINDETQCDFMLYVRYFCEWTACVLCFYFCCTFRHCSLTILGHHCWGSGHYVDVVPAFVVWAYRGSSKLWQHQRFKQLRYLHVYFCDLCFLIEVVTLNINWNI